MLAGVLVYGNSLSSPFLFDDQNSILENTTIRRLWPPSVPLDPPRETPVARRPLVNLSFAVNYAIGGLDVTGYRLGNLAVHLLAALTLFGIVRRTLRLPRLAARFGDASTNIAWACGLIWLLHPLQTETVNYLSQRTESAMGLFYLLTLYCAVRGLPRDGGTRRAERQTQAWHAAAIAACAAGMGSKESMVTAPVMVVLYDRLFVADSLRGLLPARRGLYVGLAATWLLLAALMWSTPRTSAGFGTGVAPTLYLLNQFVLIVRYLWLTIWPRALVLDYGLPQPLALGDVWPQAALLAALAVAVLWALARRPPLGFLGAWFFVTLAPASSVVPIATEVGAERRMYLPLAGLVVAAVVGWYVAVQARSRGRSLSHAALHVSLGVAVCALLAAGTVARNREYRSRLTLAQTIVERWPSGRGHFLLGSELFDANRHGEAAAEFRLSARDYPGAHFALGTMLAADGRFDEAIPELERFLETGPAGVAAAGGHHLLGQALLAQGRPDEAAAEFERLLERWPDYAKQNEVRRLIDQARAARRQ